MSDIKLDPLTGDISLVGGTFTLTNDSTGESLAQKIQIALRLFQGEWFVNAADGVPYFQQIFEFKNSKTLADAILRKYILDIPGVQSISYFQSTLDKPRRIYKLTFECTGTDGQTATVEEFTI